jgi:hypothetical protein
MIALMFQEAIHNAGGFSKLTLENTSRLAVLLSLALGRVFSQSENFCSVDLLSMSVA